jgi:hypothetical protein
MKPSTRAARIEAAYLEHQDTLARFELVRILSDARGNIPPAAGVLSWAIADLGRTGTVLARQRARALGYKDMRQISGSGTLALLSREGWLERLANDTHLGLVAIRSQS